MPAEGAVFSKILIANRGEIALRVVRACRELGVASVVVYSTEDAESAAVRAADEAVCIGPAPSRRSYLRMAAVLEAARRTGADAVHPGYGFLSESHDFAAACAHAGLTMIGPPAEVMATLGDKTAARQLMQGAGLPLLPGTREPVATADDARRRAEEIGYPVIIKAAAGGGGKGMQVIDDPAELPWRFLEARGNAQKVFGDSRVYLERYLPTARHVEVQVLADAHGHVLSLGERDCSVQRSYQKLVEETPAPGLPAGLVGAITAAAVRGAAAAGYVGAGTFEFLVGPDGGFYFMEVNCRIQVEHPVTEMATSIDLVQQQILVAAGEPLGFGPADVRPRGAVIECRVNAEDPAAGFRPGPGRLTTFEPPGGPFVRVDTHAFTGYRVPAAYDSLLAKVIVWAPDRAAAIARMRRALGEFRIAGPGVAVNTSFLLDVLADPAFAAGRHSTSIVADLMAGRPAGDRRDPAPVPA
jgi:acetyl-CoA carboxylase biotin carboxylase subunit